jgi:hypothetical protein
MKFFDLKVVLLSAYAYNDEGVQMFSDYIIDDDYNISRGK